MAGEALVNFKSEEWPSDGTHIDRAPDLPLEERADYKRMGRPWCRRVGAPAVDSSDEEMVDEPDAPRSPLLMPPTADAPAAAPAPDPDAAPAAAPAAAPPVPGSPAAEAEVGVKSLPTQRVIDPVGRLHRGDHTLEHIENCKQKRCRVCHMNGRRRDTRFMYHSAGSMRNAAANTILHLCTGVRRPKGQWRAQPATAGRPKGIKGCRLPPPLVPRAKRNKMQDSSMEEGENQTEESGHLVSVLQLFFMYFIVLYLFGLRLG